MHLARDWSLTIYVSSSIANLTILFSINLTILFTHHTPDRPFVHAESTTSVNNYSHTLGVSLVVGGEEIMRNVYVCNIRLKQLESEPVWSENGGDGEVELAVCETVVETLGQWH